MSPSLIRKIRQSYLQWTTKPWPHDDKYLAVLWSETYKAVGGRGKARMQEKLVYMKERMIEDHDNIWSTL